MYNETTRKKTGDSNFRFCRFCFLIEQKNEKTKKGRLYEDVNLSSLPPADRTEIYKDLMRVLAQLHSGK